MEATLRDHSKSFAELDTVKTVLGILCSNGEIDIPNHKEKTPVHIFTNSMYTQNVLCAADFSTP